MLFLFLDRKLKSYEFIHTLTCITETWRDRKEAEEERVNIICWTSHIVYSSESGEIQIRVCFCSDMDEKPQSTDREGTCVRTEGGMEQA